MKTVIGFILLVLLFTVHFVSLFGRKWLTLNDDHAGLWEKCTESGCKWMTKTPSFDGLFIHEVFRKVAAVKKFLKNTVREKFPCIYNLQIKTCNYTKINYCSTTSVSDFVEKESLKGREF